MNAPSLNDLRNGLQPLENGGDDGKMDQIRELLFGDFVQQNTARITALEERMAQMETTMQRGLDALQARCDALSGEFHSDQRSAFDEVARGVTELSERIRKLARD
ncbi:MAG: hypothetical protein AAFR04_06865 [Pseudomonadota bacterium]